MVCSFVGREGLNWLCVDTFTICVHMNLFTKTIAGDHQHGPRAVDRGEGLDRGTLRTASFVYLYMCVHTCTTTPNQNTTTTPTTKINRPCNRAGGSRARRSTCSTRSPCRATTRSGAWRTCFSRRTTWCVGLVWVVWMDVYERMDGRARHPNRLTDRPTESTNHTHTPSPNQNATTNNQKYNRTRPPPSCLRAPASSPRTARASSRGSRSATW